MTGFALQSWGIVSAELDLKNLDQDTSASQSSQKPSSKFLSTEVWEIVANYMMPNNHPIKEKLDQIFSASRVFCNLNSMQAAGYAPTTPQRNSQLIVTRHPAFKGFVFKAYLDTQSYFQKEPEYLHWVKRVKGANSIRQSIKKHHYRHLFKVPKKWLYFLPDTPSPPKQCLRKLFVLVEEDMNICDKIENNKIWKSETVTKEFLNAFFTIITDVGLRDTSPANCTFSRDGRIAFVDTESCDRSPVKHEPVLRCLTKKMQKHWLNLFQQKGIFHPTNLSKQSRSK